MECLKQALLFDKINDEYIEDVDIEDYLILANKQNFKIKCFLNHELIFCNGSKIKPYFRHKNVCDFNNCYMSKWHLEFQSNFNKDEIEIEFNKKDERQIKKRRADIILKNTEYIIELQHSKIELQEVRNRMHDYKLHNKEILWIIDGNNKINVINNNNRLYLEFKGFLNWKYESFKDYKVIFIDINENIYIIFPNLIKNNMIDVIKPYEKKEFINLLKTNIQQINKDIPFQSNLYIKQQGAGNGKTFGIIQSIDNNDDFLLYNSFIIVSKQHSAKTIIYNEFKNQYNDGKLKNIENIEFIENGKQYIISYYNKINNFNCKIVICTIDSLFFQLGNFNNTYTNKFEGLIQSIITDFNKDRVIYNSLNFKLNKNLCLIIDETQDLSNDYGRAIINIIKNSYIDAYIVGDKLQSISFENNAFLYLINNDFTDLYIKKIKYDDINICRRFINKSLINFINDKIPFNDYELLPITPYKNDDINTNNLCIFNREPIHNLKENDKNINNAINDILDFYIEEVNINNRKPKDFLIITPFTTKNWFCEALERSIQIFWSNKIKEKSYKRFVVFHKSETGTCIDLNESLDKTRIVSIHTSKGDGRDVVFIIGLTSDALLRFSNGQYNLVYNSLIHVALTRQKQKLYIRLENNNDEIYKKFLNNITDDNIIPNISKYIKLDTKKINNSLNTNIILNSIYKDYTIVNEKNDKKLIDLSHHNIRFACIYTHFIIYSNKYDNKNQIKAIFNDIIKSKIKICNNWKEYNDCLWINKEINNKKIFNKDKIIKYKTIPIINLNDNYFNIILDNIKNIKNKLENDKYFKLCPFERILLLYMKDICNIPFNLNISITEIYNIIDNFNNAFNYDLEGHNRCLCKNQLKNNEINNQNNDYKYLQKFYQEMINISSIYKKFFNNFNNLNILLDHNISVIFNCDLELKKRFPIILFNDEFVFNIYIKPNLIELNYYEILNESLIDLFLIKNCKGKDNNSEDNILRFHNKKIKTLVFCLNLDDYFEIEWNDKDYKKDIILDVIKDYMKNELKFKTNNLYSNYNYYKKSNNLNNLKKDFKEKNKDLPDFIISFFDRIDEEFEDNNQEITKENFNFLLNTKIENIIKKISI